MTAHTSSRTNLPRENFETRFGPAAKKSRVSRPRKRLSCGQGRDFFRMAASFADADRRDSDFTEQARQVSHDVLNELAISKLLQSRYQERSALFVTKKELIPPPIFPPSSFGYTVLAKWQRAGGVHGDSIDTHFFDDALDQNLPHPSIKHSHAKNGIEFSMRECSFLLRMAEGLVVKEYLARAKCTLAINMSATDFHRRFRKCMDFLKPRPFICTAMSGAGEQRLLVERARLFWSHRLHNKAMQATNTAEPSICYFHAALRSNVEPYSFDVLYWLKLDEEKVALDGDFINLTANTVSVSDLFFVDALVFDPTLRNACLASVNSPAKLFIEEVSKMVGSQRMALRDRSTSTL